MKRQKIQPMTNAEKINVANWIIDNGVNIPQNRKENLIYSNYVVKSAATIIPSYVLKYIKSEEDLELFKGFYRLVRFSKMKNIPNNLRPKWEEYKKFASLNQANKERVLENIWKFVWEDSNLIIVIIF